MNDNDDETSFNHYTSTGNNIECSNILSKDATRKLADAINSGVGDGVPNELLDGSHLDTQNTYQITCPYCGYKNLDSWEEHMDDGDVETQICGRCDKDFECSCDVSVTYSTDKIKETIT